MKDLTAVRRFLNRVRRINSGGCGISALSMYLWERANGNEPNDCFVFCSKSYENTDYEKNVNILRNNTKETPNVPYHIFYKKNGKYYDSESVCTKEQVLEMYPKILECPLKFLIETIQYGTNWNDYFDREQEVPVIEDNLQIKLASLVL